MHPATRWCRWCRWCIFKLNYRNMKRNTKNEINIFRTSLVRTFLKDAGASCTHKDLVKSSMADWAFSRTSSRNWSYSSCRQQWFLTWSDPRPPVLLSSETCQGKLLSCPFLELSLGLPTCLPIGGASFRHPCSLRERCVADPASFTKVWRATK